MTDLPSNVELIEIIFLAVMATRTDERFEENVLTTSGIIFAMQSNELESRRKTDKRDIFTQRCGDLR